MDSSPRTDLLTFAREHLGVELEPWQRELLAALERGEHLHVGGSRGYGKRWAFQVWERWQRTRGFVFAGTPYGPSTWVRRRGPARVLPFRPRESQ